MSESESNPSENQPATPSPAAPKLDPVSLLFALGSETRWPIVKMLADGRTLSISQIAGALGRDLDGIGRQWKVLRDAGAVEARDGEDRRQTVYQIPAARRPSPGMLDYGFCVLDLRRL